VATRNWREVRGERALNEVRIEAFRQLMAAQQRIAEALATGGVSDAELAAALAAAEEALPRDEHDQRPFFTPALERYVAALGGRLESSRNGRLESTRDGRLESGRDGPVEAAAVGPGLLAVFPHVTVTIDEVPGS
jgi:hypothetical protein